MATIADFIEELQKSTYAFRQRIGSLTEMQQRMQESVRPFLEAQERLRRSLEPIVEMQRHLAEIAAIARIPEVLSNKLSEIAKPAIELRRQLEAVAWPAFADLAEHLRKLPKRTSDALLVLANHGWFLDLEMPLPALWELEKALQSGSVEAAQQALMVHFRDRSSEISDRLAVEFPQRAKLLKTAFDAHARGEYELSIPVFLAQADGICQELIGVQLFKKRQNRPATAAYVEAIASDTFLAAVLFPLAHPLPISSTAHQRGGDFHDLNRHQVLHGESVDYGTEINSLKAISLLNYVADVLKRDSKET